MTPDSTIILNQKLRIAKLEKANKVLVQVKRQLKNELVEVKKATRWKSLTAKANKYDSLLKKYQDLMVENKLNEQMMVDMRRSVQNLLK